MEGRVACWTDFPVLDLQGIEQGLEHAFQVEEGERTRSGFEPGSWPAVAGKGDAESSALVGQVTIAPEEGTGYLEECQALVGVLQVAGHHIEEAWKERHPPH